MPQEHERHCPVCNMDIQEYDIEYQYQKVYFYFCSAQCEERFKSNPHLYIGASGRLSVKQRGEKIIKKRIMKLEKPIPNDVAKTLTEGLYEMMGIKNIVINGKEIVISYDLLEATSLQIEKRIEQMGEQLKSSWVNNIKFAFIHYKEETEIDNLEQDATSPHTHCKHK